MSTSTFFNFYNSYSEQTLYEDLIIEGIKNYGHDVYYCPRTLVADDDIYGEDTISEYNSAYYVETYIKSYDAYEGDGSFLSKFNLEIRDQIRFIIAGRTFQNEIGCEENLDRPQEGDLIYSPMMKRVFVIMFVNDKTTFYQLGHLPAYELTCEVWEYSSQRLDTGIPEIDSIAHKHSLDLASFGINTNISETLVDNNGQPLTQGQFDYDEQNQDIFADNDEFASENSSNNIADFSKSDPFAPGGNC